MHNNLETSLDAYTYAVQIGPCSFKRSAKLDSDLKHLDVLLSCIKLPVVDGKTQRAETKAWSISQDICVKLHRLWNLLFGTHDWYNEARARQLLKAYGSLPRDLRPKEEMEAKVGEIVRQPREEQLLAIYDELASRSALTGQDLLKGINRDDLLADAGFSFTQLLPLLPEMENFKKVGQKLLSAIGSAAAQKAFSSIGETLITPMGAALASLVGQKSCRLMQKLFVAFAKDLGFTYKAKPFSANEGMNVLPFSARRLEQIPADKASNPLAIVPYRP